MSTVLVTGGTGFVGKALTAMLVDKGYQVIVLTRKGEDVKTTHKVAYAIWDVEKQTIDVSAIQAADHIIHLAGAGVADKRWTATYKKKILESRTKSSALLISALKNHPHKVQSLISASAIGWYGEDKQPGHFFKEEEPADKGFLGQTCVAWEKSVEIAASLGIRVCKFRTAIVLDKNGGALQEFEKPLKFGIAGILGSGKQMVSWIHREDLCRAYIYAVENTGMRGSYNACASIPVSNKKLVLELATRLKGKFFIPMHVPAFILKIILGESSIEVLKSTTVSNDKMHAAGFHVLYPSIEAALDEIIKKQL